MPTQRTHVAAIQVELEGGCGIVCDPRPGRVLIVGPRHTFAELADSINQAFARWDPSHLHGFELGDGRLIGIPDPDFEEPEWLALTSATTGATAAGCWPRKVDPSEECGAPPCASGPGLGLGWIPDQYGRESAEDLDLGQ